MSEPKFTIAEDGNGLWQVMDRETGRPALAHGMSQTGLTDREALEIARWLNRVAAKGAVSKEALIRDVREGE